MKCVIIGNFIRDWKSVFLVAYFPVDLWPPDRQAPVSWGGPGMCKDEKKHNIIS